MSQNSLYSDEATLYYALSQDRDFHAELRALGIGRDTTKGQRLLELFAGPAYHSVALRKLGWQGQLVAVDSSQHMQALAIQHGFPSDQSYLVADACEVFQSLPAQTEFSNVLALRWSLGLVPPEKAEHVVRGVCERLKQGGQAFFELHRVDLIAGNLADLSIRTRTTTVGDAQVTCVWPSGELSWAVGEWAVTMPILLRRESPAGATEVTTTSHEWIYVRRDFQSWTKDLPIVVEEVHPSAVRTKIVALRSYSPKGQTSQVKVSRPAYY